MKPSLFVFMLLVLDQASKYSVANYYNKKINIFPFLDIYYNENYGIAFSFLENTNHIFIAVSTIIIIIFMLLNLQKASAKLSFIGYLMIISGALSNLIDRIRLGYVVDFIFFHINNKFNFAIFNLADSFITIGVVLIIISEFLCKKSSCK